MTFLETIYELEEATTNIDILAIGCTTNGKPDIGIRVNTVYDDTMKDPIIDGIPFMICGDIYDEDDYGRISDIKELSWKHRDTIYVRLRAIAGYRATAKIDLGQYRVVDLRKLELGNNAPTVYKLSLIAR